MPWTPQPWTECSASQSARPKTAPSASASRPSRSRSAPLLDVRCPHATAIRTFHLRKSLFEVAIPTFHRREVPTCHRDPHLASPTDAPRPSRSPPSISASRPFEVAIPTFDRYKVPICHRDPHLPSPQTAFCARDLDLASPQGGLFERQSRKSPRKKCFGRKRLEVLFHSSVTWPMEEGTRTHGARARHAIRAGDFEANVQGRWTDGSPDSRNHSGSTRREKGQTIDTF